MIKKVIHKKTEVIEAKDITANHLTILKVGDLLYRLNYCEFSKYYTFLSFNNADVFGKRFPSIEELLDDVKNNGELFVLDGIGDIKDL